MNADVTRSSLRSLAAGLLLALALSACTSVSEDYQQRQNLVYVPSHAQPVDKVRWDHMRNIRPLNERMILIDVRRQPHLLVLATACGATASWSWANDSTSIRSVMLSASSIRGGSSTSPPAYPMRSTLSRTKTSTNSRRRSERAVESP